MKTKNNPLDTLYQLRSRSIVIALTGVTGSGCTTIADIMSRSFNDLKNYIRPIDDIQKYRAQDNMREERFKHEYSICYNYCAHNYDDNAKFKVIRYRNVLLYCVIKYFVEKDEKNIVNAFIFALNDLLVFQKGKENEHKLLSLNEEVVEKCGLNEGLLAKFEAIKDFKSNKNDYRRLTYDLFYSEPFSQFCENLFDCLKSGDYFAKNYLVHKLACAFRGHGSPERTYPDGDFDNQNVYHVVTVINDIIKGAKYQEVPVLTHFVIDSIRNSIELAYLRERYHSFYSVAVHNLDEDLIKKLIKNKVQKKMHGANEGTINSQVELILNINSTEEKVEDFENGRFYAPDIARCVAESEMHFCYRECVPEGKAPFSFYTNGEQWLRFVSLILRPGIVTPTRDERCMAIAYVAKYNSGCISRQVGCAIVDDNYLFKSIGWNDPPAGQLPCSLRSVSGLLNTDPGDNNYRCYSCFEQCGTVPKTNRLFSDYIREETKNLIGPIQDSGLSYPFCFSSRYNKYYGQKDKVNTRSLHAEENAILRLRDKVEGGQMFVTASPCVLCSKKAYQIGIKRIVFLDPYSDIAPMHIIQCGDNSPKLESFMGAIGETYYRLFRPYLPYKDELSILESELVKE